MSTAVLSPKIQSMIPKFDSDAEKERIFAMFDAEELDQIELMGSRILVAKWIREKAGSIMLSAKTKLEDGFQGKVGLVLKVGPLAFEDDANHDWRGQRAKQGDWIVYSYSDGQDFDYSLMGSFERVPCKILDEGSVQMIVRRPDFAY